MKDPSEKVLQYIVDGNDGKSAGEERRSWLDANPTLYPINKPKHAWIGSLVNEPGPGDIICFFNILCFLTLINFTFTGEEINAELVTCY